MWIILVTIYIRRIIKFDVDYFDYYEYLKNLLNLMWII